jgi:hypothetical protein
MKFLAAQIVAALLVAFAAGPVVAADKGAATTLSAHNGATVATMSLTKITKGSMELRTFDLGGRLLVRYKGATVIDANPWQYIVRQDNNDYHNVDGFSDIDILTLAAAPLDDTPQADIVMTAMFCGANCSGASAVLAYDAGKGKYVEVSPTYPPEWDAVANGKVQRMPDGRSAIVTTTVSPFDNCHACLPGSVPLVLRIVKMAIVDVSAQYPNRLRSDASGAWTSFTKLYASKSQDDQDLAQPQLFRYLADECRLGACAAAWSKARASYKRTDADQTFAQITKGLSAGGFTP